MKMKRIALRKIVVSLLLLMGLINSGLVFAESETKSIVNATDGVVKMYGFRLHPGDDLLKGIESFVLKHRIKAAAVVTVVGSLTTAKIRFANQEESSELNGHFEIVSMEGTDGCKNPGEGHYHIAISDEKGQTFGGHLVAGSIVYTTAEVVIAEIPDVEFVREYDKETTYDELVVRPAHGNCSCVVKSESKT